MRRSTNLTGTLFVGLYLELFLKLKCLPNSSLQEPSAALELIQKSKVVFVRIYLSFSA